ncbi:MAG: CAAD domain-containing protein [Xenococcaceae cyanobacterium]
MSEKLSGKQTSQLIEQLLNYVKNFFSAYKRPLFLIALILVVLATLKIILEMLDAINDIPLIEPTLELIGIVYTIWFVYRYLITPARRVELSSKFNSLKNSFFDTDNSES